MLHFVGDGEQKKFTKISRHFSMQNSQANAKKKFTKFFWRAGKVIKGVCVQLEGGRFLLQGPRFPIQGHRFPLQALGSPYGLSVTAWVLIA